MKKIRFTRFVISLFIFATVLFPVTPKGSSMAQQEAPTRVFFPEFTAESAAQLRLIDSSDEDTDYTYIADSVLRLTDSRECCQAGAAWYHVPLDVGERFDTIFDFRINELNGSGADGLAFIIHNDPRGASALGQGGCSMGYGSDDPTVVITNSLAIEFDTYLNGRDSHGNDWPCSYLEDPNDNHVGIMHNGPDHGNGLADPVNLGEIDLSDGNTHTARIRYQAGEGGNDGLLQVYLDEIELTDSPIITAEVDLASALNLTNGQAWVGFASGSGTDWETHEILNWYYISDWQLTCVGYDFSDGIGTNHSFDATWIESLGVIGYGSVSMDRGHGYYDSNRLMDTIDGFPNWKLTLLYGSEKYSPPFQPLPIEQIRVAMDWGYDARYTLQSSDQLSVTYALEVTADHDQGSSLFGGQAFSLAELQASGTYSPTIVFAMPEGVVSPDGIRVVASARSADGTRIRDVALRFLKLDFCVDAGPQGGDARPPVMPPGATEACQQLLTNLASRFQPFGSDLNGVPVAKRSELSLFDDDHDGKVDADLALEPYPEFRFDDDGSYPPTMRYDASVMAGYDVIPCVFKKNGEIYNPAQMALSAEARIPIIRFTVMGDDANRKEWLKLLNYGAYFTVGPRYWCYPGDNAFARYFDGYLDQSGEEDHPYYKWTPGYNVPAPRRACEPDESDNSSGDGPCGTFASSLFRAMGYYNVSNDLDAAFSDYENRDNLVGIFWNIYYGTLGYLKTLPENQANLSQRFSPHVRVTSQSPDSYAVFATNFAQLDVYLKSGDRRVFVSAGCKEIDTLVDGDECKGDRDTLDALLASHTLEKELVQGFAANDQAEQIWQRIKPGDIVINSVVAGEGTAESFIDLGDFPIHVQVVVGWGPSSAVNVNDGSNLYPTYNDIPDEELERDLYVPFIMDRYQYEGRAGEPRAFNREIYQTFSTFFVAEYPDVPVADSTQPELPRQSGFLTASMMPQNNQVDLDLKLPDVSASVAWSPDGNHIAVGSRSGVGLFTPALEPALALENAGSAINDLAWSPDGTKLAGAGASQDFSVWNVTTGRSIVHLYAHNAELTNIAWSPDGSKLATSSKDGIVHVWDAQRFKLLYSPIYTGTAYLHGLAWSPTGDLLAGGDATHLFVWDATSGNLTATIQTRFTNWSLDWTPDGKGLVTPGPTIWEISMGKEIGSYTACAGGSDNLALLSADGQQIVSVGSSVTGPLACLTQRTSQGYEGGKKILSPFAYAAAFSDAAWSPDGKHIALVTYNGWLQLWDTETGELLSTAARPKATYAELEKIIFSCTAPDLSLGLSLVNRVHDNNFSGYLAQLGALSPGKLSQGCSQLLQTTGAYFLDNPPPVPAVETAWQPLALADSCSMASTRKWTITNPNPFEISVYWRWSQPSQGGGYSFVVPAAKGSAPGRWTLETPLFADTDAIIISSGNFTATAVADPSFCPAAYLPAITK